MCNCGHDDLEEAKRLKRRSISAAVAAMCVGLVLTQVAKGHPPVMWLGIAVQVMLLTVALRLVLLRRRLVCGEAR